MADPEAIYNWRRLDNRITTSGQPTEKQLADIHALSPRRAWRGRSEGTYRHGADLAPGGHLGGVYPSLG